MSFSQVSAFLIALIPALALADSSLPVKPAFSATVEVRRTGKPPERVTGTLVKWDDTKFTLHVKDADRAFKWDELTGTSAFLFRSQIIDKKDAQAWMKLGTLAWGLNDIRDGKNALAQAGKLDPSLKGDIEAVEASSAGILIDPPGPELMHEAPEGEADPAPLKGDPHTLKPKYRKTTPAEAKAAMASNRADAKVVSQKMSIDLKEVETDHFLVFTDWSPNSYAFIKENLEAANRAVSKQFDIQSSENIFVGKLAVYMFERHSDFLAFGEKFDHLPPINGIQGYYASRGTVAAHMAMSKPDFGSGHEQETEWAYVLTHEFTHAFVARYRSTRRIPTWVNEGLAEVIASSQFPRDVRPIIAEVVTAHRPMSPIFDDDMSPSAIAYPVMRTLTELLILKDRKKFLVMFDELKAGATGAKALKDVYGMTFEDLEKAWYAYVGR